MSDIELIHTDLELWTKGLLKHEHKELTVQVSDPSLLGEGEDFLLQVINYILNQKENIEPGETLAYGYWLTKFQAQDNKCLEVWEYNAQATEFIPGASLTLTYWRDQHQTCNQVGAAFSPPRPDQLVVVSEGVFEGDLIQGIHYPSPEHMSGWWITTDRYNGDIHSLKRQHLYHLTAARPDLARYIALPYGYRFHLEDREYIWFDEEVASRRPS